MRTNNINLQNSLIDLKNQNWLEKQRIAGRITAGALSLLQQETKLGTTKSLLELDKLAETYIRDNECIPTFLHYRGFPNSVCISVNNQLVHGIPTNYCLQNGDIVSFDLGATYEGAIADSAITCIYGEPKKQEHVRLLEACYQSLLRGIEAVSVSKKIGCIGDAIYKSSKNSGFNLIQQYGGHGISWNKPHTEPFIANRSSPDIGARIQPGLTIAIEPMLIIGDTATHIDKDGWTVWGKNLSCHWEHTIFVHEDRVEIITKRDE
jgi:methionyl aminopeptidase